VASPLVCCVEETVVGSRAAAVAEGRTRADREDTAFADGACRDNMLDMRLCSIERSCGVESLGMGGVEVMNISE
jgi:hypothetical protein